MKKVLENQEQARADTKEYRSEKLKYMKAFVEANTHKQT